MINIFVFKDSNLYVSIIGIETEMYFNRKETTLLHYGSLPFTSVVGSESRPS